MRKPESKIDADNHSGVGDDDLGDTAVFFDFENIVLGVKGKFRPARVVEHLSSRGNVHIRRAYADWGRYSRFQSDLLELGVEMVFLPSYGVADKNRTDTAVCVDAMEILFLRENIDTFVIVSGDSDFGVLARKLRGYGKRVIGISAKTSASKVLAAVCHEFIFYESLTGERLQGYTLADGEKLIRRVLPDLTENRDDFQASLLKDRMRKVDSTFHERNFGFNSFLSFVESYPALLEIRRMPGSGVRLAVKEAAARNLQAPNGSGSGSNDSGGGQPAPQKAAPPKSDSGPSRSRRSRSRRGKRDDDRQNGHATSSGRNDNGSGSDRTSDAAPSKQAANQAAKQAARAAPADKAELSQQARQRALDAFRVLLNRILASEKEPVTLNRLKKRLTEAVPSFDHEKLGYDRFIDFVRGQEDIASLLKKGRSYRVAPA